MNILSIVIYFNFLLMGICLLIMLWCVIRLYRNNRVYLYRKFLIDVIWEVMDSSSKDDLSWRLAVYNSVTYNEMVTKFWKPLDSFYKDKSFLKK